MVVSTIRVIGGAVLALACAAAFAQESPVYFRVTAGKSVPQNVVFLAPFIQRIPNSAAGSELNLESAYVGEAAVGWRFSPRWRADLAFSYRGNYAIDTLGYSGAGPYRQESRVRSRAIMLNGYWDMPFGSDTFRPFVGFGLGAARNSVDPVTISRQSAPFVTGQTDGATVTRAAGMFTVGTGIRLGNGWILDLAYRFTDLGIARSGTRTDIGVVHADFGRYEERLRLNEFTVGLRF